MSNNAFRVKNSLHLTPQAVEPSGLEVGDLWMDIDGNLKRWDGSASQDVGSGGVGSVDIMFAQTLEQAVIGDFTTTGTVAIVEIATNPLDILQGKKTLKITHTGGASAEQIVEVPAKFRNKNVTLSLDVNSDATSGNLSLTVTDQTNTVTLINAESIQPQEAGQTSVKRSVSFNVPSDCEELKYKFTAVSESGAISLIDNVVIELTQTAKLDTTIEVPVITEWVDAGPITITSTGAPSPTKGTAAVDKVFVRRNGSNMDVRFEYRQTTGGTPGSGDYLFAIPSSFGSYSGVQIDTTKVTPYSVIEGGPGGFNTNNTVGIASVNLPTETTTANVLVYNSSSVRFGCVYSNGTNSNHGIVGGGFFTLANANMNYVASFSVPILGWEATETQSVSLAQTVLVQESDSAFTGLGFVGNGSTNTGVIRLSGSVSNYGDALTYVSSSVDGDSWVVNKAGIYDVHASVDTSGGAAYAYYFTKNATVLTATAASTHPITSRLSNTGYANINNDVAQISGSDYLEVGDVIRFHCASSGVTASNGQYDVIKISYQGKLKQLNVSENQKIEIPTSELRITGSTSRGTANAGNRVKFNDLVSLRGDAFTIINDATGTSVVMKKAGRLSISSSLVAASSTYGQVICGGKIVSAFDVGTNGGSGSWDGYVNIGDTAFVVSGLNPNGNSAISLNLSFQEQEVAVSVTNVLPQFSESDSSVRVDTANGYGSPTGTRIRRFSNVRDNLGSAIAYNDGSLGLPATVGDYFIINESGDYDISYTDSLSVDQSYLGLSKNASSLTTNIDAIASVERLALSRTSGTIGTCAWSGYLQAGDVIRAHTEATASSNVNHATFTISKVGKPNVTGVDVTPFAKIEYEVKQFIEQIAATSVWVSNIARFQNLNLNTNNGLIQYSDDGTNGTRFTALKSCEVSVSVNGKTTSTSAVFIRRNGVTIATGYGSTAAESDLSTSVAVRLNTGDYIDITRDTTASPSVRYLNIVATELRDAYQVIGGGVENTYSAIISSTPSIQTQSYPFIDSVTSGGTGVYNINLKAGFFPVIPSVSATSLDSNGRIAAVTSITTSLITVRTFNDAGTNTASPFSILVQRQGSDYRTPSKAIGLPAQRVAYIKDVKANGTSGGAFTSGAWQTRTLNALTDPTGLVTSLASNQFVLPAGVYDIEASAPAYKVGRHKAKIRNTTDSLDVLIGEGSYTDSADNTQTTAIISGRISITSSKTFELQHRCQTSAAGNGFGVDSNFVVDEVYAQVKITRIEE